MQLPATLAGDLPCADCEALRYHLDVFDDGVYFLRRIYVGRSPSGVDDIGKWKIAADGRTLELHGQHKPAELFEIRDATTLRKLDLAGKAIESEHNYDLKRQAALAPIEPTLRLRGTYSSMTDAATFTECVTGKRLVVAQEADNAALQSAYAKMRTAPGAMMLASVDGRIAMRPPMEGRGLKPTLIVERFHNVSAESNCEAEMSNATLENTYWKLTSLRDRPVTVTDSRQEPHLILHADKKRVAGSGGCNQLIGSYTVDGNQLALGRLASTRRACLQGMDLEQDFLNALPSVRQWRIGGEQLDLLDDSGSVVAQFASQSMK